MEKDECCGTQSSPIRDILPRDPEMKIFIGTKILRAKPMKENDWLDMGSTGIHNQDNPDGYLVIYDNDYKSWSPKEVFETHYREVTQSEKLTVNY